MSIAASPGHRLCAFSSTLTFDSAYIGGYGGRYYDSPGYRPFHLYQSTWRLTNTTINKPCTIFRDGLVIPFQCLTIDNSKLYFDQTTIDTLRFTLSSGSELTATRSIMYKLSGTVRGKLTFDSSEMRQSETFPQLLIRQQGTFITTNSLIDLDFPWSSNTTSIAVIESSSWTLTNSTVRLGTSVTGLTCNFVNCPSAMTIMDSKFDMRSSRISSSFGWKYGIGIANSSALMVESVFADSSSMGALIVYDSIVTMTNFSFISLQATDSVIQSFRNQIFLQDVKFQSNTGQNLIKADEDTKITATALTLANNNVQFGTNSSSSCVRVLRNLTNERMNERTN